VKAKQLQRQVVCTVLLCFFRLFLFDRFSACWHALAQAVQDNANPCSRGNPCNACHNVYSNILFWILNSPVFQPLVTAIAGVRARGEGNDCGRNKCHDDGGGGGDLETNHLAVVAHACVSQNKKSSLNGVRVYRSRIQRDSSIRDDDPRDLEIRILLSCLF
jgi:hypothetical protein